MRSPLTEKPKLSLITAKLAAPETEFSTEFVQAMANRMAVSFHKYGPVFEGYPARVNALQSMVDRMAKYNETGNGEWLVDAANFLMIEFMHPAHPEAHFRPTDSDESPGRVRVDGTVDAGRNL